MMKTTDDTTGDNELDNWEIEHTFPYTGIDYTIGAILCFILPVGTALNILAFLYFKCKKAKNCTSMFFKRIYLSISLNDAVICIAIFPVIEAAFSKNRHGTMFNNELFCGCCSIIWIAQYFTSITLVALLSLSRLMVIINHKLQLIPVLGTLVPLITFSLFSVTLVMLTLGKIVYPMYNDYQLRCMMSPFSLSDNGTDVLTSQSQILNSKKKVFISSLVALVCFAVVFISFILSMIYLERSKKISKRVRGGIKEQTEAGKTVILVTLVYILFNFPTMMISLYTSYNWFIVQDTMSITTTDHFVERASAKLFGNNTFLNQYAVAVTVVMATCLNSFANPLVYWARMEGFGRYVKRMMAHKATQIRTTRAGMKFVTKPGDTDTTREIQTLDQKVTQLGTEYTTKEIVGGGE